MPCISLLHYIEITDLVDDFCDGDSLAELLNEIGANYRKRPTAWRKSMREELHAHLDDDGRALLTVLAEFKEE